MNEKAFQRQLNEQAFLAGYRKQRASAEEWVTLRKEDNVRDVMDDIKAVFEWDALVELEGFSTGYPFNPQISLWDKRDCHMTVTPRKNKVRESLEYMDTYIRQEKEVKVIEALDEDLLFLVGRALDAQSDLNLVLTAQVAGDNDMLNRVFQAARTLAAGKTAKLNKPFDNARGLELVLGGAYSPSLVRVPVTPKGTLDIRRLKGTAMDPTVEFLSYGGYDLPAPAFIEEYATLQLYTLRENRKTKEIEEVDLGLWYDLNPGVVSMNTATRNLKSERSALIDIGESFESSLQRIWQSKVMENHSGWCRMAQLHVQVDLGPYDARVDRKTAEFIRIGLGLKTIDEVDGQMLDLTGYPMVNAACRPRVTIRVCQEEGVQQSIAISPFLATLMGRDNDGDVCALHNAYVAMNGAVLDLLTYKGEYNDN